MTISNLHDNACYLEIYKYGMIIWYINDYLDPTSYLLNFGVTAINQTHPKVMIRFTLKNVRNNISKG